MVLYTDNYCLNQLFHLELQNCYFLILSFMKSHISLLHVAGQFFFPLALEEERGLFFGESKTDVFDLDDTH